MNLKIILVPEISTDKVQQKRKKIALADNACQMHAVELFGKKSSSMFRHFGYFFKGREMFFC